MCLPTAPKEMERTHSPGTAGPTALPPEKDGTLSTLQRQGVRFAVGLFLFLGILAAVGAVAALAAFSAPGAVYGARGWLIVLGAVTAAGVVLLAVAAPRAGYRWFEGGLFLVPVYGQMVFAPRALWRASRPRARWAQPKSAGHGLGPPETPHGLGRGGDLADRREAERIKEEARTLAELLSGRRRPTAPESAEVKVVVRIPEAIPEKGELESLIRVEPPVEPPPVEPAPEAQRQESRRGRWVVPVALILLFLVLAAVAGAGARELVRLGDRADRVAEEVRAAHLELVTIRQEIALLRSEMDGLAEGLPPDVPALIGRVKGSVVTVKVAGHGFGSGFAIEGGFLPKGYRTAVLTSEHVVRAARSRRVSVTVTQGQRSFRARLGRLDRINDLALLFVKARLPALPWASQEGHEPRVGEFVVAIGSPYGLEGSTTVGVVSNLFPEAIQTDAPINPGNSGGPLLNRHGEVLAINAFSLRGARGLGFAVRIEAACDRLVPC